MITKAPRFSRSVHILRPLHWLSVKFRIYFKICILIFRTLKDNHCYTYLTCSAEMLKITTIHNFKLICCSPYKTNTGSRDLYISSPALWNVLPVPIPNAGRILTFSKLLKSHLLPGACAAFHYREGGIKSWNLEKYGGVNALIFLKSAA